MEKDFILAFSAFSGIGTVRFNKLITTFGSAENAWIADVKEIQQTIGEKTGKDFYVFKKNFAVEEYAAEVRKKDIHWFTPHDKEYPVLLKKIEKPPFILFAKGNVSLLTDNKTVAVVGTRKVTPYGQQATEMLVRELVNSGFVIVSGMAFGVDGFAHKTALENNGKTIAVLGSGVDMPTPREHARLYQQILENNGLIVSTFSPGEGASIGSFPARNAIVAGISLGVVVTEGAEDSGSLITADYAKKYGRPIFAVPGQITSTQSIGTNNLIKQGAIPVSLSQDILDSLGIMEIQNAKYSSSKARSSHSIRTINLNPEEEEILSLLENGPLHFDEIVRTIGKDSKTIGQLLSLLELKGSVKTNQEGKYYL